MKQITQYILEKFKINSKTAKQQYKYFPETRTELKELIEKRLEENKNVNLNDIDISHIDDLSGIFMDLDPHNIDISEWDVSNVTNMTSLFGGCKKFNCDISNWDVSNVEMMNATFYDCKNFDCDLSNWDVSKVKRWNICFGGGCGIKEHHKPKFNWKNVK